MDVKKEIFGKLDSIAKPGAILASNTSYLDIDEIAASTSRPQDVVGLHFFSPANVMKLLEVVRGAKTAPDVLVTAMNLAKKIKKVAVVAGVCYGFIGNRMLIPRQTEAMRLLLEGATPEQVDKVHVAFGMPMGPFQMADLAGVDIGWHRDPSRSKYPRRAVRYGSLGPEEGAGFYDYDEKRRPSPSPSSRASSRISVPAKASSPARSAIRRYRAHPVHDGERGREDPGRGHGPARLRHRCGLDLRLWLAGLSRAARCSGRTPKACPRSSRA
jgi:3-hydroxyacyl-CoA dehydrogenase